MRARVSSLTPDECKAIWHGHGHLLRRRCRMILRDDALGDDALQETFVKLLRYGGEYRNAASPLRFLYRVADRCCFELLERRSSRREDAPPDDWHGFAAPGVDPALRGAVLGFLHALSPEERQLAVLVFVDGLSQGEAAEEIGVSRVTVNKRVQALRERAERALRTPRREDG